MVSPTTHASPAEGYANHHATAPHPTVHLLQMILTSLTGDSRFEIDLSHRDRLADYHALRRNLPPTHWLASGTFHLAQVRVRVCSRAPSRSQRQHTYCTPSTHDLVKTHLRTWKVLQHV